MPLIYIARRTFFNCDYKVVTSRWYRYCPETKPSANILPNRRSNRGDCHWLCV